MKTMTNVSGQDTCSSVDFSLQFCNLAKNRLLRRIQRFFEAPDTPDSLKIAILKKLRIAKLLQSVASPVRCLFALS